MSESGPPPGGTSLLHLDGVSRSVELPDGSVLAILTDVRLDVCEGEHVAIVGRSGSGKSTLLNILGLLDTQGHFKSRPADLIISVGDAAGV